MRQRAPSQHKAKGLLFLFTLFALTGVLTLTMVGLTRSATDLMGANRLVATHQAFSLAEAGLDRALTDATLLNRDFPTLEDVNSLLRGPNTVCDNTAGSDDGLLLATAQYTLRIVDNADADVTPCADTDRQVVLLATGRSGTTQQVVSATLQLAASAPASNPAFKYSIAAHTINMNGQAQIGSLAERSMIYVKDTFITDRGNDVYATQIDSPRPITCGNCGDPGVFHPVVNFNTSADPINSVQLDLKPYYDAAIAQEAVDPGKHYINTSKNFACGITIEGVIYVEAYADVTFCGNTTINGTIVHEGGGGHGIRVLSRGDSLTIDSTRTNRFGQPFAKGLAIIGQPMLDFRAQAAMNITGFAMTDGGATIAADGTIRGGIIAVECPFSVLACREFISKPGAGSGGFSPFALEAGIIDVEIGGQATIFFQALDGVLPGLPTESGGSTKPLVLMWSAQ